MANYINTILNNVQSKIVIFILVILYFINYDISYCNAQTVKSNLKWSQFIEKYSDLQKTPKSIQFYLLFNENAGVSSLAQIQENFSVVRRLDEQNFIVKLKDAYSHQSVGYRFYPANNLWKLNEQLLQQYNDPQIKTFQNDFLIYVNNQSDDLPKSYNLKRIAYNVYKYRGRLTRVTLEELLANNNIEAITIESLLPKGEATVLDLNLNPNRINTVHNLYPYLTGENELISIQESFYDTDDIDLKGRYVNSGLESEFSENHATQMATIIAGNGNSFVTGRGVATNVNHSSVSFADIAPQTDAYFNENDVQVQNHSYGTAIEPFYGVLAQSYDKSAFNNKTLLHIQSSGNSGLEESEEGQYAGLPGFANLTGNYKNAKNTLAVASVDTTGNHIPYSSSGPAFDGRIKPELSTYSIAGTSNSAAMVSGTGILMQQQFKMLYGSAMPSALAKAILINSADDVGNLGPDFKTGYGQLNALAAIETINNQHFISGVISSQSSAFSQSIQIPNNAIKVKVTLVWNDVPANPNDAIALINDLDLSVSVSGDEHLPFILDSSPNETSLNKAAITGQDHLNNVEQVFINNPSGEEVIIEVTPYDISSTEQKFYIAYQYDIADSFRWTSPTSTDNIPYNGETTSHLRWENSYDISTGQLYYRLTGTSDNQWKLVSETVDLRSENFRWYNPKINELAQLKMEIGNDEFISDTFSISVPTRLSVSFNCEDSLAVSWNSFQSVDYYKLSNIQNDQPRVLYEQADTSITIQKAVLSSNFLRLTPYIDGKPLISSFTVDYDLQGAFCYINNLYTYVEQDSGVFIYSELGGINNISEVIMQKEVGNSWQDVIAEVPKEEVVKLLDENPDNGLNNYRLLINFINGEQIISDKLNAFFVKDEDFLVFPNPVNSDQDIRVFGKSVRQIHEFRLTTIYGKEVLHYNFDDDRLFIERPQVDAGLYLYQIIKNGELVASGKLLFY